MPTVWWRSALGRREWNSERLQHGGNHDSTLVVERNYGPEGVTEDEVIGNPAGHLGAITIVFQREDDMTQTRATGSMPNICQTER
jgi:hypothetical protein